MTRKGSHLRSVALGEKLLRLLSVLLVMSPSFLGTDVRELKAFIADIECKVDALNAADDIAEKMRGQERARFTGSDFTPKTPGTVWKGSLSHDECPEGTFLKCFGMTKSVFDELVGLARCFPEGQRRDHVAVAAGPGRPTALDTAETMSAALGWMRGAGNTIEHAKINHIRPELFLPILEAGIQLLLLASRAHPLATILWPSKEMQLLYADCLANLGDEKIPEWVSMRHKPFILADGYVVEIMKDGNVVVERAYHNVKSGLDSILNVIVRSPDGLAVTVFANYPGGASELATIHPLIQRLRNRAETIPYGMVMCDTAYRALDKQDCVMATHSSGEVAQNWAGGDLVLNNILARICYTHRQFIGKSCQL